MIKDFVYRDEAIFDLCRGKRVLHIGCIGATDHPVQEKLELAKQSFHYYLSQICDCVGIDNDKASIDLLRQRGIFSNVLFGDAEKLGDRRALGTFDVVLASDILEHIGNPGLLLAACHNFLLPNGKLIVTAPNAFGLPNFLRYVHGSFREGAQHVLSFNDQTMTQLLERYGYRVSTMQTCYQKIAASKGILVFSLGRLALQTFPKLGGTLLCVAERAPKFIAP
jgi:SAM-dependent methyltransferase